MRITWITQGMAPSIVEYGTNSGEYDTFAKGDHKTYHYFMYSSGRIHNVVIGPLKPNTTYYYRCSNKGPQFSLRTPPPSFPIEFAIVGKSFINFLLLLFKFHTLLVNLLLNLYIIKSA